MISGAEKVAAAAGFAAIPGDARARGFAAKGDGISAPNIPGIIMLGKKAPLRAAGFIIGIAGGGNNGLRLLEADGPPVDDPAWLAGLWWAAGMCSIGLGELGAPAVGAEAAGAFPPDSKRPGTKDFACAFNPPAPPLAPPWRGWLPSPPPLPDVGVALCRDSDAPSTLAGEDSGEFTDTATDMIGLKD